VAITNTLAYCSSSRDEQKKFNSIVGTSKLQRYLNFAVLGFVSNLKVKNRKFYSQEQKFISLY
jgi:hypothetical protein